MRKPSLNQLLKDAEKIYVIFEKLDPLFADLTKLRQVLYVACNVNLKIRSRLLHILLQY